MWGWAVILGHEQAAELRQSLSSQKDIDILRHSFIAMSVDCHAADDGIRNVGFFQFLDEAAHGLMYFAAAFEEHVDPIQEVTPLARQLTGRFEMRL